MTTQRSLKMHVTSPELRELRDYTDFVQEIDTSGPTSSDAQADSTRACKTEITLPRCGLASTD